MQSNENALLSSRSVYCKSSVTPLLLDITIIIIFPPYNTNNFIARRVCFISHYHLSDSPYSQSDNTVLLDYVVSVAYLQTTFLPVITYSMTTNSNVV